MQAASGFRESSKQVAAIVRHDGDDVIACLLLRAASSEQAMGRSHEHRQPSIMHNRQDRVDQHYR